MNLSQLILDLGEDAYLIMKSDKWLQEQQAYLSGLLDRYTQEYKAIQAAKAVKMLLQSQNMVAMPRVNATTPEDSIEITKLPEAATRFSALPVSDMANIVPTLVDDGYDIIHSYLIGKAYEEIQIQRGN